MSEEIQVLHGHAFRVRFLAVLSGLILLIGTMLAGSENFSGRSALGRAGQWAVGLGFFGLVAAGLWVRYARCPDCGAFMKQGDGHDPEKLSGIFACPGCGKRWRTPERSRMHCGVE